LNEGAGEQLKDAMNFKSLFVVSLAANVVLGWYAFRPPAGSPAGPTSATQSVAAAPVVPKAKAPKSESRVSQEAVTNTLVKRFNWESVESADYKEYIANLRSVGCPEETIRDIILADVNKLYDEKKKQVRGTPKKFEYWKGGNAWMSNVDPEIMAKTRALDEERNAFLKTLGITPDFKTEAAQVFNPFETMMDFLPDGKKTQVLKLFADMQEKMAKITKDGQPDGRDYMKIQKEMEDSVKQMLSPEEALQFELRFSTTANMMRSQITGFEPNEEEFMSIYKLRKSFDDQFSPMSMGDESDEERKKRAEADKALKEKIKETLGAERYKDYELAQDWQFQQTVRALKRVDLGVAEAKQVSEMKRLAEEQASKIRNNKALTSEQRTAALTAVRQETENSLKSTLGEKGWGAYNKQNNVYWLNNINPQAQPKKTTQ
jgi:hypothetical protein